MKLSRCNIIYVFFEATSRVRYELSKLHTLEISPIDLCDTGTVTVQTRDPTFR